jgi:hypothetical protein
MRQLYRSITLAVALAATASVTVAVAQDNPAANPARRTTGDVFNFGGTPLRNSESLINGSVFENPNVAHGIGRSARTGTTHITPVPEPSQWAMMLAGLALVGFIVRRNAKRKKDD